MAKETTSTSPHPIWQDPRAAQQWVICVPVVCRKPPWWRHAGNLFHSPTRRLSLYKLSVSCRDTLHGGRNRTHLLDSVSSRRYLCHQDRLLFASSLPAFLPLLLSPSLPFSFAQILVTCALCVRNLVGNLSMASQTTPLREYSFH